MGRPRAFATDVVLDAAKDAFWGRGYEATSLADLEVVTGLSRSSLYQAFGSKRGLFEAALVRYREQQVDPVLVALEGSNAALAELQQYFSTLAAMFRADPKLAVRGCLVVNTMSELAGRDDTARAQAAAYHQRITAALANGLRGAAEQQDAEESPTSDNPRTLGEQGPDVEHRARVLCSAVIGALVTAHFDPEAAATLCEQLSADVSARPATAAVA
jgi:TetR/AcrR family transcriptional repressor of nem operon